MLRLEEKVGSYSVMHKMMDCGLLRVIKPLFPSFSQRNTNIEMNGHLFRHSQKTAHFKANKTSDDLYSFFLSYIRGAFNKFPDSFVQAFKIVVDS